MQPAIAAAVDIGSTSVHLLVGRIDDHRLEPLADESAFLGLGAAAQERGALRTGERNVLVATLGRYAGIARDLNAAMATFVATEPLRRLADAPAIVHRVGAETGIPLHVLSHEEEGLLVLIGVTGGRPVEDDLLVVDIGGGSSEFVAVGPGRRAVATGVKVGAAHLVSGHVRHDPPTADDVAALRLAARAAVDTAPRADPDELVVVGGTASNLLKIVPEAAASRRLTRAVIDEALAALTMRSAEVTASRYAVRAARARILPAGAAIVEAILDRYGLDEARVSEGGIREGAIQAVAHAGIGWRDRLEELAHGWRE